LLGDLWGGGPMGKGKDLGEEKRPVGGRSFSPDRGKKEKGKGGGSLNWLMRRKDTEEEVLGFYFYSLKKAPGKWGGEKKKGFSLDNENGKKIPERKKGERSSLRGGGIFLQHLGKNRKKMAGFPPWRHKRERLAKR